MGKVGSKQAPKLVSWFSRIYFENSNIRSISKKKNVNDGEKLVGF